MLIRRPYRALLTASPLSLLLITSISVFAANAEQDNDIALKTSTFPARGPQMDFLTGASVTTTPTL